MKKLFVLLFSLFFLSSPSVFAEDISDFKIEGIGIGDSLLDYMTEDEILKEIERTKDEFWHLKEPNKYAHVTLTKEFKSYVSLSFIIKNNSTNQYVTDINEKFTILYIAGMISYNEDFDGCMAKRNEIEVILSSMFSDIDKQILTYNYAPDPSGDSIIDEVEYVFDSGAEIQAQCINLNETWRIKNNYREGLSVGILTKEIIEWMTNKK